MVQFRLLPSLLAVLVTAHAPGAAVPRGPSGWQEQKIAADDPGGGDLFGTSLAIAGSASLVGSPYATIGDNAGQGTAYVFGATGGLWSQTAKLTADDGAANDNFGYAVATDGTLALVGAPGNNGLQGAVYAFTQSGSGWTEGQKIVADDGAAGDFFGQRVILAGDIAIISASYAAIDGHAAAGAVYVFTESAGSWTQAQKLTATDGAAGDQFGNALALDGDMLVVGAPYHAVGGHARQGAAYVFDGSGGTWSQAQEISASDGASANFFGWSVGVSGSSLLVGADHATVGGNGNQGAVYVFASSGGSWTQTQKLTSSDGAANDNFGWSLVVDGTNAFVGANFASVDGQSQQGAAYLFADSQGSWTETQKFTASDGAAGDKYGQAVAISGATLFVSANWAGVDGVASAGAAYFYSPQSSPPAVTITPDSMSFALTSGASTSSPLTITDSGGSELAFAITESADGDDCSMTSGVPWLDENPPTGSIAAGDSQSVAIGIDATGLSAGDYSATLCIATNDPDHAQLAVPVTLTVSADDTIFADGFDAPP